MKAEGLDGKKWPAVEEQKWVTGEECDKGEIDKMTWENSMAAGADREGERKRVVEKRAWENWMIKMGKG